MHTKLVYMHSLSSNGSFHLLLSIYCNSFITFLADLDKSTLPSALQVIEGKTMADQLFITAGRHAPFNIP